MHTQTPASLISVPLVHREADLASATVSPVAPLSRILLAITGDATSTGAARTAAALAARHRAEVRVVSVFTPRVGYPAIADGVAPPPILPSDRPAADAQLGAVRRQVASVAPGDARWPAELLVGHIGPQIARAATTSHADLVIIGNGRACARDRGLGDRGALVIAACIEAPLLAAAERFDGAPRTVMFTVGLDECSLRAVETAVAMLPEPARVVVAHARIATPGTPANGGREADAEAMASRIDEVRAALARWQASRVDVVMLTGDPVHGLLGLAKDREVDLIVGGLHGGSYYQRALARNLALGLLAEAECSVLLLPLPTSAAVSPVQAAAGPPTN